MGPHRDIKKGSILYFTWDTNDANGASVNPTVAGTISVYKDDNIVQSVAGITDTRSFDGLVGLHNVKIDTSNAFYEVGKDYHVVLSACTIDGQVVNATLFELSIDHSDIDICDQGIAQAGAASGIQLALTASAINDFYAGSIAYIGSGSGAGQSPRIITAYDGATKWATIYPGWAIAALPDNTSVYKVMPIGPSMLDAAEPALQALIVTTLVNAFHDEDTQLHLGPAIDNRTLSGMLAQALGSKYQNRILVKAIAPIVAQGITAGMVAAGCIQYETINISMTRNFAAPDFTYYLLWRYNALSEVVEQKASLGIVW